MDLLGLKESIDTLNNGTIPQVLSAAHRLVDRMEDLVDRFDGATLTASVILHFKPKPAPDRPPGG